MIPLYKIEKGVPLPTRPRGNRGFTATLRKCEIGDSFVVPKDAGRTGLYTIARNLRMRISIRTEVEGLRVWRIT